MRNLIAGLKRWWLRRFRGVVAPPRGQKGTTWQQHDVMTIGFVCNGRLAGGLPCGQAQAFSGENFVVRHQDHVEGCQFPTVDGKPLCGCPVTDARYIRICSGCGLGHWRQA